MIIVVLIRLLKSVVLIFLRFMLPQEEGLGYHVPFESEFGPFLLQKQNGKKNETKKQKQRIKY